MRTVSYRMPFNTPFNYLELLQAKHGLERGIYEVAQCLSFASLFDLRMYRFSAKINACACLLLALQGTSENAGCLVADELPQDEQAELSECAKCLACIFGNLERLGLFAVSSALPERLK